jgi:hypothetical protein
LASLVLKNGESYLGRYKADQLDGLVQETISLCDRYTQSFKVLFLNIQNNYLMLKYYSRDNVNREVFYSRQKNLL